MNQITCSSSKQKTTSNIQGIFVVLKLIKSELFSNQVTNITRSKSIRPNSDLNNKTHSAGSVTGACGRLLRKRSLSFLQMIFWLLLLWPLSPPCKTAGNSGSPLHLPVPGPSGGVVNATVYILSSSLNSPLLLLLILPSLTWIEVWCPLPGPEEAGLAVVTPDLKAGFVIFMSISLLQQEEILFNEGQKVKDLFPYFVSKVSGKITKYTDLEKISMKSIPIKVCRWSRKRASGWAQLLEPKAAALRRS